MSEYKDIKHLVLWAIRTFAIKLPKNYTSENLVQDVAVHYFFNKKEWSSSYIVSITRWIAYNQRNKKTKNEPFTPVLRDHIAEVVKMFGFTKEQWDYLNQAAADPLKLYKEQEAKKNEPGTNQVVPGNSSS